ncbi:MAG: fasciclin domain-containing protein [Nitrospirales bacterium]|nr:fasciclin domain-containing protein [Nitrospirales bacterium]
MKPLNRKLPKKQFFLSSLTALAMTLTLLAWVHSADAATEKTITEIVGQSGGEFDRNSRDFDILLNAVLAAGLDDELADPGADVTVFAPNDRAFIRLAQDLGFEGRDEAGAYDFIVNALTDLGGGNPIPVLIDVLLFHVSAGAKSAATVGNAEVIDTLFLDATILPQLTKTRKSFRVTLVDNDPEFIDPRIVGSGSDIEASNGKIQTVDRVLIPLDLPGPNDGSLPTITELVAASGGEFDRTSRDYDILLNAVLAVGLQDALGDPNADLTVFAPNDRAFILLARALGNRGYGEEDAFNFLVAALTELGGGDFKPLLTNILLYHVSPSSQTVKDVVLSDEVVTLLTGVTFEPMGMTLMDNEPALEDPMIIGKSSNINAANGRVHTINHVLIPAEIVD